MAASLKMEAPLRPNVLANLVGTKHVLELAKQMRNLVRMVHLSTAFCNVEPKVVYEKIYPHQHNPDDLIRMSETMTDAEMEAIQKEFLGVFPDTYVYTKRLAEILVEREYENLPVCIVRPTVILPTYREPFPGWVDNLNGVTGIFYAGGRGVLRSMLADPDSPFEYLPVDMAINAIIMIPKLISTYQRPKEIPVYHLTAHDLQKIPINKLFNMVTKIGHEFPCSWPLWYPNGKITANKFKHDVNVLLFQTVPAYVIDFLLFCFRQKRL
jgi:fatty acyl-CoA reductase